MNFLQLFKISLTNPIQLVSIVGYAGLIAIIFAETGLLFGFFLPGDSLLVAAGVVTAASPLFHIPTLCFSLSVAAILGDLLGYALGYKLGPVLYEKKDSLFFKRKHMERGRAFYEKHGGKTIIFARFIPIVRTFAPTVAGAAKMTYKKFVLYNVLGGILWVNTFVLGGYYLGQTIPNINSHMHWILGIIIILSFLPIVAEVLKKRKIDAVK